jgi:hypothetical protein
MHWMNVSTTRWIISWRRRDLFAIPCRFLDLEVMALIADRIRSLSLFYSSRRSLRIFVSEIPEDVIVRRYAHRAMCRAIAVEFWTSFGQIVKAILHFDRIRIIRVIAARGRPKKHEAEIKFFRWIAICRRSRQSPLMVNLWTAWWRHCCW